MAYRYPYFNDDTKAHIYYSHAPHVKTWDKTVFLEKEPYYLETIKFGVRYGIITDSYGDRLDLFYQFWNAIGKTQSGEMLYRLKAVVTTWGLVISAYPIRYAIFITMHVLNGGLLWRACSKRTLMNDPILV